MLIVLGNIPPTTYITISGCLGLQVVAILEAGQPLPFRVKAANLDLPELQGEPVDIAREKCRLASEKVLPSPAQGYVGISQAMMTLPNLLQINCLQLHLSFLFRSYCKVAANMCMCMLR